jgi:hypothetical protein
LDDVKNLLKEKIDLKYIKEWSVKLAAMGIVICNRDNLRTISL